MPTVEGLLNKRICRDCVSACFSHTLPHLLNLLVCHSEEGIHTLSRQGSTDHIQASFLHMNGLIQRIREEVTAHLMCGHFELVNHFQIHVQPQVKLGGIPGEVNKEGQLRFNLMRWNDRKTLEG